MKLLLEVNEQIEMLEEADAKTGKKSLYIVGPFLQANKENKNRRVYPTEILSKEVKRYNEQYVQKSRAYGELGHPQGPIINLDRCSHMIKELKQDGDNFIGKAKIMDTPMGNIVKNLMAEGANLGVSSRGMGTLKVNQKGIAEVQKDFYLATAADIVADPSAPDAYVNGIMENADWWFDGVTWRMQEQIDRDRQQIKKMSTRQLEEMKLKLFENFLAKL